MRTAETDLRDIKSMMERSSRFISLSGLSGVFAGIYALAGLWVIHAYYHQYTVFGELEAIATFRYVRITPVLYIALMVLVASLLTAIFFTTRNARKKNQRIWDKRSRQMLANLAIPLFTGGVFILLLIHNGYFTLVAPATLVFYGLALINGSKYTLNDIRYLGYLEILLGLFCMVVGKYYLTALAIGFGVLHIVYGAAMYWKYER